VLPSSAHLSFTSQSTMCLLWKIPCACHGRYKLFDYVIHNMYMLYNVPSMMYISNCIVCFYCSLHYFTEYHSKYILYHVAAALPLAMHILSSSFLSNNKPYTALHCYYRAITTANWYAMNHTMSSLHYFTEYHCKYILCHVAAAVPLAMLIMSSSFLSKYEHILHYIVTTVP
jgi:hypothetical protein